MKYQYRDEYALVFELENVLLRINHLSGFKAVESTVLGWAVDNIENKITKLIEKGVTMVKYDLFLIMMN